LEPTPDEQLAQSAWVRRLAQNLLRDPALAEDAAQLGSIADWQNGPINSHARASWLATTVRRLAGRLARGEARRSARERSAARPEALPSAAELVERAEAHRALVAAVLALDEPYRSTILLRFVEDLAPRAIARREGVPVATVRTRLARGLERLRRELEQRHGDAREWLGLLLPFSIPVHPPPILLGTTLLKSAKLVPVALLLLLAAAGLFLALREHEAPSLDAPQAAVAACEADAVRSRVDTRGSPSERADVAASSPSKASDAAQDPPLTEEFRGRVVDLREDPIAGARIRFLHSPSYGYYIFHAEFEEAERELGDSLSDAQGRFALSVPYGMLIGLHVSATGFADEHLAARFGGDVVVHLGSAAGLSGFVTRRTDGQPVRDAAVRVRAGVDEGVERVVQTDANGRYLVEGLPPGPLGMLVAPEHEAMTRWEELELQPGQTLQHDVIVETGQSVRGRVLDHASGAPIEGADVSAWEFIYKTVRTDAHGAFELGGTPGRQLQLSARARGYARTDVRVLDSSEEVELRLARGQRATGRLLGPDGAPIAGGFVGVVAYDGREGVARSDMRATSSAADGRFEIGDLRSDLPHTLYLRADGRGERWIGFPVPEPALIDFGDLRLEPPALVEGRVLEAGGGPPAEIRVRLHPASSGGAPADHVAPREVSTDALGRFVFRDLGAAEWILSVQAPGILAPPEQSMKLSPGETRRGIELRLGDGQSIEGLVEDEPGHSLAGALVTAVPEGGSRGIRQALSDSEGRFQLSGLPVGKWTVRVSGPRSEGESRSRYEELLQSHVEPGTRGLELRLRSRSSSIRGRVLEADGKPVRGAFVFTIDAGLPPREFVLSDDSGNFEFPIAPGGGEQLFAQRGIPLSRALRAPTAAEFHAGWVADDDAQARVLSRALSAGTTDAEFRLRPPR